MSVIDLNRIKDNVVREQLRKLSQQIQSLSLNGSTGARGPKGDTGATGAAGDPATFKTRYFTLSNLDEANQSITLPDTPPQPTEVNLEIIGGCSQNYGSDFEVTGNTLSWAGKTLETVLSQGDKIKILYSTITT